jgi:uncharacterized protein YbjQ (UPF0145 family)
MIVTTTENIPKNKITSIIGVAFGSCVQTKHLGKDIGAHLRSLVGGEARAYTEMLEEARRTATDRMVNMAQAMGGDAVVGMRYTTAEIMVGAAEIIAYGTCVKIKRME